MKSFFCLIPVIAFMSHSSFAGEKCSDVLNWDMQRFGKGTFDKPIGLNKVPGHPPNNKSHTYYEMKDSEDFGFVVHMDDKNKDRITSYFITGARYGTTEKRGQFQTYVELDSNCRVTRYVSGWRFTDGKGNVDIKNDFEITAKACQELYPQAVNANKNLLCEAKALNDFLKQRGSSINQADSPTIARVMKVCFERPFAISPNQNNKAYHQEPPAQIAN
jgi:hypothetical protein